MATILIVDDRPANREFLVALLGYGGHRLLEAGDGAEGLEVVRAEARRGSRSCGPSGRAW